MSTAVGNVNFISYKLKWEIENFGKTCTQEQFGLMSPEFRTNDRIDSDMKSFLYGPSAVDKKDLLSLFFFGIEVGDKVNLKIFNNKGEVVTDQTLDHVHGSNSAKSCSEFISRDFLSNPANDVLNDDKLTIVFEITEKDKKVKRNRAKNREEKEEDIRLEVIDEYEALVNNDKFSDVSLIAEGKTVKAHKCILAKGSSVFAIMFDTDMMEKQKNTVEIEDVKYDVLVELVRFIYAGRVNNIVAIVDELAIAAEKYALDGLKKMCERTMGENLGLDNFLGCLQLADRLHMDKLKQVAIEFILENASDISDRPEFDSLPDDIVRYVFRCLAKKVKA